MKILITGIAGFIGFHVANELKKKHDIYGIDCMTEFYDVSIKKERLKILDISKDKLSNHKVSFASIIGFNIDKFDLIIHLAAQAGVPFSQKYPEITLEMNMESTLGVFEYAKSYNIPVIFASSSSVYELKSFYSMTKKWNEEIAEFYNSVTSIGLRFFSIYGTHGRPDQVFYKWIDLLKKGQEIQLNGSKNMDVRRNFTNVKDVVKYIKDAICFVNENTGQFITDVKNNKNESLSKCISIIENLMNVKANIKRCELEDYDPLIVKGKDVGIDGIHIEDGLKELTEYLGVYDGSKSD